MKNTADGSRPLFEPCHIDTVESPFLSHERKSAAHSDRLLFPSGMEKDTEAAVIGEKEQE